MIVGGDLDPEASTDADQAEQIRCLHELMDEHQLDGRVRWMAMQTDKHLVGELYRQVADTRGAFAHTS